MRLPIRRCPPRPVSACGSLVTDVENLASTLTSSDKTNQQKADAAKSFGSQISDDAKAASGALQDKLNSLSDQVSALATDIQNGASIGQITSGVSKIVSSATSAAAACITQ